MKTLLSQDKLWPWGQKQMAKEKKWKETCTEVGRGVWMRVSRIWKMAAVDYFNLRSRKCRISQKHLHEWINCRMAGDSIGVVFYEFSQFLSSLLILNVYLLCYSKLLFRSEIFQRQSLKCVCRDRASWLPFKQWKRHSVLLTMNKYRETVVSQIRQKIE